ncbi:hypothetical protein DdX_07923 [Ditylenchus destructor]|uniref:Uncharacterized protein n=1 Tax=Ditylenchus destructor TaxID=166010 RepID=A0AAD4N7Y7_9BILA|nr:hypothetical protein DdX_07923 [Ditylenchus destructor]
MREPKTRDVVRSESESNIQRPETRDLTIIILCCQYSRSAKARGEGRSESKIQTPKMRDSKARAAKARDEDRSKSESEIQRPEMRHPKTRVQGLMRLSCYGAEGPR